MRRILLSFIGIAAFSVLCVAQEKVKEKEKEKKEKIKVEGSGNVISNNVSVQPFDQLDVSGVFHVQLSQGSKEEVKIEADDNLQQYFEVKNEGSKLVINMQKDINFSAKKKIRVYVTFKNLTDMNLKTVGDVSSEENLSFSDLKLGNKSVGDVDLKLTAKSVDLDNKSVGDMTLSGKADNVVIRNKSVGSLNAGTFVVQKMDIDNHGVGSAEVNAEKELKVKDSFLGKVNNKGAATAKRTEKVKI
jgi:hypothetical protein